jgi:hypothetical protein
MKAIMVESKPAPFGRQPTLHDYKNAMIGKAYKALSPSPLKEKSATR